MFYTFMQYYKLSNLLSIKLIGVNLYGSIIRKLSLSSKEYMDKFSPHSSFKKNHNQSYYENGQMSNQSFNQNNQSQSYYSKNNNYQQGYPNNQQRWNQYSGYNQYNEYGHNGYWNNQQQYNFRQNNWNNPERNKNQSGNQYGQSQRNQNNSFHSNQANNQWTYENNHWNQTEEWPKQENVVNQSLSVRSVDPNINDSFLKQAFPEGVQEVGRFGGKKKKKNRKNKLNESVSSSASSSQSSQGPKPKVPTIKEESSNEFYFPTSTEITEHCVCPFNSQHIMEPDRLLTHINNCKLKSQNSIYYAQCPYEPTHYVYTNEIEAHKLACPKRYQFVVASGWDEVQDLPVNQVNLANNEDELNFSNYNDVTTISTKKDPSNSSSEKEQFQNHLIEP